MEVHGMESSLGYLFTWKKTPKHSSYCPEKKKQESPNLKD